MNAQVRRERTEGHNTKYRMDKESYVTRILKLHDTWAHKPTKQLCVLLQENVEQPDMPTFEEQAKMQDGPE